MRCVLRCICRIRASIFKKGGSFYRAESKVIAAQRRQIPVDGPAIQMVYLVLDAFGLETCEFLLTELVMGVEIAHSDGVGTIDLDLLVGERETPLHQGRLVRARLENLWIGHAIRVRRPEGLAQAGGLGPRPASLGVSVRAPELIPAHIHDENAL